MSESHQRKMKLFIEAPKKFMNDFSREFDHGFMQILRLKGGRRVKANEVYQDYIANRQHIHMNATVWSTLTGYVLYLGKTGKAKVERAENEGNGKGWYVTYIDRDPEVISKQEKVKKMQKMEERERRMEAEKIQRIIEKNQKLNKIRGNDYEISGISKSDKDEKIAFGFKPKPKIIDEEEEQELNNNNNDDENQDIDLKVNDVQNSNDNQKKNRKRKLSNLQALIEENEDKKRRKLNDDKDKETWLCKGIVVKIKEGDYGGKKGVVMDIVIKNNKIKAILKLLKCKEDIELKIKDKYLETVIPSFGRDVKILCGKYRNCNGVLKSINEKRYCGNIELMLDNRNTKIVSIPFENFSKVAK